MELIRSMSDRTEVSFPKRERKNRRIIDTSSIHCFENQHAAADMRGGARPSNVCERGCETNQQKAGQYNFRTRRDLTCSEISTSTRFLLELAASCNHTIAEPSEALSARAGRGCKAKNDTVAARNRVVARLITVFSMA
jgi:hypothetical protein